MERIKHNPILIWIKNRIKANKNVILVVNGATGSGKTYSAIALAKQIADMFKTNFSIKENLDFNFTGLIKKMDLPQNGRKGTVFIFEEVGAAGSEAASMEWQSKTNRFFNSFLQTSRHQNQILIFTCPFFANLDKRCRSLAHMQMQTDGIDFKKKIAFLRPYRIQVNSRTGQFYFKYLRCYYEGKYFKFKRLEVPHPPMDMSEEYEKIKTKYTNQMRKDIIDKSKEKPKTKSKVDLEKLKDYINKDMKTSEIAKIYGVTERTIQYKTKKLRENNEIQVNNIRKQGISDTKRQKPSISTQLGGYDK